MFIWPLLRIANHIYWRVRFDSKLHTPEASFYVKGNHRLNVLPKCTCLWLFLLQKNTQEIVDDLHCTVHLESSVNGCYARWPMLLLPALLKPLLMVSEGPASLANVKALCLPHCPAVWSHVIIWPQCSMSTMVYHILAYKKLIWMTFTFYWFKWYFWNTITLSRHDRLQP